MIVSAILVVVAIAAASYWLVWRRRPAPVRHPPRGQASVPGRKAKAPGAPAAPRYGAVEIQARNTACEAARSLGGRRFLANEAPALPLPGCTAAQCTCAFVKLSDRRTEDRRLEHAGLGASLFLAKSRREQRGRREDDKSQ